MCIGLAAEICFNLTLLNERSHLETYKYKILGFSIVLLENIYQLQLLFFFNFLYRYSLLRVEWGLKRGSEEFSTKWLLAVIIKKIFCYRFSFRKGGGSIVSR